MVWIQTYLSSRFEAARGKILPREFREGTEAQRRSDSEPAEKSRENLRVREDTRVVPCVTIERAEGA